jgi:Zn-finger nucleic acid-binding protein/DNA-directed RNA polymerase subunit RPC12/RpoP
MNCPNCGEEMIAMDLEARMRGSIAIDVCTKCQAFWFDKYESLRLAAGSTLRLMKLIGENSREGMKTFSNSLRCPRCAIQLRRTNDMQRATRFTYWRCTKEHGRFIRFFEFLREKDFIKPLSRKQIEELRQNVQNLNCSNCGAPIDLASASECEHCGSPISVLDMKRPQQLLEQLAQANQSKPVDPTVVFDLARAKRDVERWMGLPDTNSEWSEAASSGLVQAGLRTVARWLTK